MCLCANCQDDLDTYFVIDGERYCPICARIKAESIIAEQEDAGEHTSDDDYEDAIEEIKGECYHAYGEDEYYSEMIFEG